MDMYMNFCPPLFCSSQVVHCRRSRFRRPPYITLMSSGLPPVGSDVQDDYFPSEVVDAAPAPVKQVIVAAVPVSRPLGHDEPLRASSSAGESNESIVAARPCDTAAQVGALDCTQSINRSKDTSLGGSDVANPNDAVLPAESPTPAPSSKVHDAGPSSHHTLNDHHHHHHAAGETLLRTPHSLPPAGGGAQLEDQQRAPFVLLEYMSNAFAVLWDYKLHAIVTASSGYLEEYATHAVGLVEVSHALVADPPTVAATAQFVRSSAEAFRFESMLLIALLLCVVGSRLMNLRFVRYTRALEEEATKQASATTALSARRATAASRRSASPVVLVEPIKLAAALET